MPLLRTLLLTQAVAAAALTARHPSPVRAAVVARAAAADEPITDFFAFLEETKPSSAPPEAPSQTDAPCGLDAWLRAGGVDCDAVQVASIPGYGRGLVAKRAIDGGELVLSVPQPLYLSPSAYLEVLAKSGPTGVQVSQAFAPLMQTPDGQSTLLALSLLYELSRGDSSSFAPYLAMLPPPEDLDVPLLWSGSMLESLLRGSHLVARVARLRSDLLVEHAGFEEDLFAAERSLFPEAWFSEGRYMWAHAIVLSRGLRLGDEVCLVPLLDFANHEGGCMNEWTSAASTGTAALLAGQPIAEGEQVFIDYGQGLPRRSWEFLFSHGVVPEVRGIAAEAAAAYWLEQGGRPMQVMVLRSEDPLLQQKKALLVALGADEDVDEGVEIQLRPGNPTEGAAVLRLGQLDLEDAPALAKTLAAWEADPREMWAALQRPIAEALEERVAAQLVRLSEQALELLPPSAALAIAAAKDPSSPAQERERGAARVLLGERHALEACRDYWQKPAPRPVIQEEARLKRIE